MWGCSGGHPSCLHSKHGGAGQRYNPGVFLSSALSSSFCYCSFEGRFHLFEAIVIPSTLQPITMVAKRRAEASSSDASRSKRSRLPTARALESSQQSFASDGTLRSDNQIMEVEETPPSSFVPSLAQEEARRLRTEMVELKAQEAEAVAAAEVVTLKAELNEVKKRVGFSGYVPDEESVEGRRSFLQSDNDPHFLPLVKMFPAVNRKHFVKICREIFMPEQLHKLVNDYFARNALGIEVEEGLSVSDIKSMTHLTRCFEVYCQIILELAPPPVYRDLNKALSTYRCRLNKLVPSYIFDSILAFHKTFMYTRINQVQDDPEA